VKMHFFLTVRKHRRRKNVSARHSYEKTMEMTDVSSSRIPSSRPGPTRLGSIQVRTLYRHLIKNSSPHPRFVSMHWRNAPQTSIVSKQVNAISL